MDGHDAGQPDAEQGKRVGRTVNEPGPVPAHPQGQRQVRPDEARARIPVGHQIDALADPEGFDEGADVTSDPGGILGESVGVERDSKWWAGWRLRLRRSYRSGLASRAPRRLAGRGIVRSHASTR